MIEISNLMPIVENKNIKTKSNIIVLEKYCVDKNKNDNNITSLTIPQLKQKCRDMKIKNYSKMKKNELVETIKQRLLQNEKAILIQKIWRRHIVNKYLNLKAPKHAWTPKNRINVCKNDNDFYTFEPLSDIPFHQFITYEDENQCLWGFDILSIYNYISHSINVRKTKIINNPFTNLPFSSIFLGNVERIITLGKLLNVTLDFTIETHIQNEEEIVNEKLLTILYHMEQHGYIIRKDWLDNHSKTEWINFLMDLRDLWQYRIKIPHHERKQLCSPHGNPFSGISYIRELYDYNELYVKNKTYDIILNFISKGNTNAMCGLGILYVLISLRRINAIIFREYNWLSL